MLYDLHNDFSYIAYVKDRDAENILGGRPSRGVAIFWRKNISWNVSPVFVNDSVIGVDFVKNNKKYLLLNVYLPWYLQTVDSLDNYRSALAQLEIIIKEQNTNSAILVGDFNANPNKGRFWSELDSFCKTLSLRPLSDRLPPDTFTYLCPAKSTTSWLDHILCTSHLSECVQDIFVEYSNAIYAHFPLCFIFPLVLRIIPKLYIRQKIL